MKELWKPIKGYEGLYEVSNLGEVRSFRRKGAKGGILKPAENRNGRLFVNLHLNNKGKVKKIHRLVAEAFVPNPEGKPEVNHIKGNPKNNHVDNLEWATSLENQEHAKRLRLNVYLGEEHPKAKLNNRQVRVMKHILKENWYGITNLSISKIFGVAPSTISDIKSGYTWSHIVI